MEVGSSNACESEREEGREDSDVNYFRKLNLHGWGRSIGACHQGLGMVVVKNDSEIVHVNKASLGKCEREILQHG